MKLMLAAILLVMPSLAYGQLIINTGNGHAALVHSQETRELLDQRTDETNERLERIEASIEALLHIKSPPPVGEVAIVKTVVVPVGKTVEVSSLRSTVNGYRGRKWYVGYVGNRNKAQLIRHIRDDHKRLTTAELNQYSVDDLLKIHGMCHDSPGMLSGGFNQAAAVQTWHYETRLVKQCTQNGCRMVRMRVRVNN